MASALSTVPYKYLPLSDPKANIRLLNIKHARRDRIECSFAEIPVASGRVYNALSYTWGDPFGKDTSKTTWQIQCDDGGYLNIGQNLYDALLHLFQVKREEVTDIWIDALCINQTDDVEKGDQIKMMHEIYSFAESVIVWLGPEDGGDPGNQMVCRVVELILKEEDHLKQRQTEDTSRHSLETNTNAQARIYSNIPPSLQDGTKAETFLETLPLIASIDAKHWRAVANLLYRAYWSRLWIWQEIVASKTQPVIVCGKAVLAWNSLRLMSQYFTLFGTSVMIRDGQSGPLANIKTPRNLPHQIAFWRDNYMEQENGRAWLRQRFGRLVLDTNRNAYQCFDERDRVFAHMGLCGYEKLQDWDYKTSFWELYQHLWYDILERIKNVNFLSFVEDASTRAARPKTMFHDVNDEARRLMKRKGGYIPTWVPDLRTRLEPLDMWSVFEGTTSFDISKNLYELATNGLCVDRAKHRLTLQGYKLDIVAQFSECYEETEQQASIPGILELIRDLLTMPSSPYKSQAESVDAVLSSIILLADLDVPAGEDQRFPVPKELTVRCRDWLLHMLAHARITSTHNYCTVRQDTLLTELEKLDTNEVIPSLDEVQAYAAACKAHTNDVVRLGNRNDLDQNPDAENVHEAEFGNVSESGPSKAADAVSVDQPENTRRHQVPDQSRGSNNKDTSTNESSRTPLLPASLIGMHQRPALRHVGMAAVSAGDWGLTRMRLFRSDKGWVGKGPQSLRIGDQLWIVPGGKAALVLRPFSTEVHTYVGHAYVHGVMNGELREQIQDCELDGIILE